MGVRLLAQRILGGLDMAVEMKGMEYALHDGSMHSCTVAEIAAGPAYFRIIVNDDVRATSYIYFDIGYIDADYATSDSRGLNAYLPGDPMLYQIWHQLLALIKENPLYALMLRGRERDLLYLIHRLPRKNFLAHLHELITMEFKARGCVGRPLISGGDVWSLELLAPEIVAHSGLPDEEVFDSWEKMSRVLDAAVKLSE